MDDDEEQLCTWKAFLARVQCEERRTDAEARGDRATARAAANVLAELPTVGALEALKANADLVSRLTVQRWIGMKIARDEGNAGAYRWAARFVVNPLSALRFKKNHVAWATQVCRVKGLPMRIDRIEPYRPENHSRRTSSASGICTWSGRNRRSGSHPAQWSVWGGYGAKEDPGVYAACDTHLKRMIDLHREDHP